MHWVWAPDEVAVMLSKQWLIVYNSESEKY